MTRYALQRDTTRAKGCCLSRPNEALSGQESRRKDCQNA